LATFTLGILKEAEKRHIRRLYFAARDMYLPYCIAKQYSLLFPHIELRYLYVSTRVIYPAMIELGTENEMLELLGMIRRFKPITILSMLGFTPDEISLLGQRMDLYADVSLHDGSIDAFIAVLQNFRKEIVGKCARKRRLLLEYLAQEGVLSNVDSVAIVDLGWRGTSQYVLRQILSRDIPFFYLGISADCLSDELTGHKYYFTCEQQYPCMSVCHYCLEYYMCKSQEGTTIDYEETPSGVLRPVLGRVEYLGDQVVLNNKKIVLEVSSKLIEVQSIYDDSLKLFYICVLKAFDEFFRHPTSHIVQTIAPHLRISHFGYEWQLVCKLNGYQKVYYLLKRFLYKLHIRLPDKFSMGWEYASLVNSFGWLGECYVKRK
jgi:hypothetical protein